MNRRVFLLALAVMLSAPCIAHAHAMLVSSSPAVGASVASAPAAITLAFTQPVDAARCTIELDAENGDRIRLGQPATSGDGSVLSAPISGALSAGGYRVLWHATNHEGHQTSGDFEFRVTG